jgi:hypothetical protein
MAGITSGARIGAERRAFRLGSMVVASTGGKKRRPHLSGHWPKWSASVKSGGTAGTARKKRR